MSELKQETINKLIKEIVEGLDVSEEKRTWVDNQISELINKVQFSDNYCPDCVERMFWKNGGFVCPKCGKSQEVALTKVEATSPVPTGVPKNPKRAATIRDLANNLGSGPITTTPVDPRDNTPLPGATSKEINWV